MRFKKSFQSLFVLCILFKGNCEGKDTTVLIDVGPGFIKKRKEKKKVCQEVIFLLNDNCSEKLF